MPRKPNTLLRIAVPAVLLLLGVGVAVSVAVNTAGQRGPTPVPARNDRAEAVPPPQPDPAQPDPAQPAPAAARDHAAPADAAPDRAEAVDAAPSPNPATPTGAAGLRFRLFEDAAPPAPLGGLDPDAGDAMRIEFAARGAGIASLALAAYYDTVEHAEHVTLQRTRSVDRNNDGVDDVSAIPFALLSVGVGPQTLNAAGAGVWRSVDESPGTFEAIVEDTSGAEVLRITRRFALDPSTYQFRVEQRFHNSTRAPLDVRLVQAGPIDLPVPQTKYGGDKRRLRFGYLLDARRQGASTAVTADDELRGRQTVLGGREKDAGVPRYTDEREVWPSGKAAADGHRLVWFALTERYFAVAVHAPVDPAAPAPGGADKLFTQVERLDRLVLNPYAPTMEDAVILTRMTSPRIAVPPGGSASSDFGVFAGPMLHDVLGADPVAQAINLNGLIAYNFGGMCGEACTFEWLTVVLIFVLKVFHAVTLDWAIAIVLLVFTVRACLHPVTRWSQIRMQRFGVQMQSMGPKMQKVRDKYKDDPKRLQEETAKLWREEGVSPAGMLGCLPMFLQSPVWIALYATLYFAGEMRHQPAFYGVFQAISGGNWKFLADLASPDAAIPLPQFMRFTPPLVGGIWGRVESVNVLPLLLGVVFFLQQKYLTPPSTGTMTPEQEQMQNTMKIMSVVMFPLFMYPAPSGLALYFITNSTLGIIESRWIREHAKKTGMLDPEKIKAEKAEKAAKRSTGGGGFMQRMQQLAEQQQQLRAQQQGGGARRVTNIAPQNPSRYKKRK